MKGKFLRGLGCDIVTAAELGLSRAADVDLLKTAGEQKRIWLRRILTAFEKWNKT